MVDSQLQQQHQLQYFQHLPLPPVPKLLPNLPLTQYSELSTQNFSNGNLGGDTPFPNFAAFLAEPTAEYRQLRQ